MRYPNGTRVLITLNCDDETTGTIIESYGEPSIQYVIRTDDGEESAGWFEGDFYPVKEVVTGFFKTLK